MNVCLFISEAVICEWMESLGLIFSTKNIYIYIQVVFWLKLISITWSFYALRVYHINTWNTRIVDVNRGFVFEEGYPPAKLYVGLLWCEISHHLLSMDHTMEPKLWADKIIKASHYYYWSSKLWLVDKDYVTWIVLCISVKSHWSRFLNPP